MARQREGDVASLTYYDTGNAAILEAGDVMNQLIGQIYDGTRVVRIIGEDESTKLVKINDPMDPSSPDLSVGLYDVAITTGASYTTRRVEAAEAMMQAVQVFPELMQIAGDLVVKAQEWPGAEELSERLRKTIPPQLLSDKEKAEMGEQGPDMQKIMAAQAQVQEKMQEAEGAIAKLTQENQTLKIKAEIEEKKLMIEEYRAETERLSAYAAIAKTDEDINMKKLEQQAHVVFEAHEHELDQSQHDFDQENYETPDTTASTQPSE
jgi:hypothetical protein